MKNQEIANILYEIAYFLETDDVPFRPYAYEKAAITVENLKEDIEKIYIKGGKKKLEAIPGIGKSIARKIEEFLKTGKIKYYEDLKKRLPVNMDELIKVGGLGPKKIKTLHQELGISNLKELEIAAKKHKIAKIFGFGEKAEKNILEGIAFLKKNKGRFLLGKIMPSIEEIYQSLRSLKEVEKISLAGSIRRKKETIGDVDFLITVKELKENSSGKEPFLVILDFFVSLPGVIKIWAKGKTKASIRLNSGIDVDLRIVPQKSYGAALQYFTGSKEHNIALRKIAINKGLKLSEYGLFKKAIIPQRKTENKDLKDSNRSWVQIGGQTEEEIYRLLKMEYIEPEMREDKGEIEAALEGKLPKLIDLGSIKGDLHCHTNWNGGVNSIEEMVKTAIEIKYQYLGITDHTKFLKIEHGLDEKELIQQKKEIDKINSKFRILNSNFFVLHGCEVNILNDGRVDIKDEVLKNLDYVIAGVHSSLKMNKKQMTERIIKAMKNPYINIIVHPTGRILDKRDEYEIDFEKIFRAAKETKTILEINSNPERLDLNDINIKRAKNEGVRMIINSDAHDKNQLYNMKFGIFQARRGWAEKKDIINSLPLKKLMAIFNEKSKRYNNLIL